MDEKTNIKDRGSRQFDEGYEAWCQMKSFLANPYEQYSFEWIDWCQGWKEAQGWHIS